MIKTSVAVTCLLLIPALSHPSHHSLYNRGVNYTQVGSARRTERSVASPWQRPPLPLDVHRSADDETEPPSSSRTERDVPTPEFRALCQTVRQRLELREIYGEGYEYRPPHVYESQCNPAATNGLLHPAENNLMCAYPGFTCVQRLQTLYLTRRKYDSDCWEVFTRNIAANCECMWPVQTLAEAVRQRYSY